MNKSKINLEIEELEKVFQKLVNFYLPKNGDLSEVDIDVLDFLKKIGDRLAFLRKQVQTQEDYNAFYTPEYQAYLKALQEKFKDEQ